MLGISMDNDTNCPIVAVLMSTYNGQKYIKEQLDSILKQENVKLDIFIRDDGSIDKTLEILNTYITKYSNIHVITGHNIGPVESFLALIYQKYEEFQYIALSDQDDIWDNDKLISAIRFIENDENIPCLYYSSVRVVDQNGNIEKVSVPKKATKNNINYIFCATGNTIIYNKQLQSTLLQYRPSHIYMHDAWLLMVAVYFGNVYVDSTPHISYRQHESNVVGMTKKRIIDRLRLFRKRNGLHSNFSKNLLLGYKNDLEEQDKKQLMEFVNYKKSAKDALKIISCKDFRNLNINEQLSVVRLVLFKKF